MDRFGGQLLAPVEGLAFDQGFLLPLGRKKRPFVLFWPILGFFCCAVVPLLTFSININFFFNPKNAKKLNKSLKISLNIEIKKKS